MSDDLPQKPSVSMFTAKTGEEIMREAELVVLRNISAQLERNGNQMDAFQNSLNETRTDIAVLKEQNKAVGRLEVTMKDGFDAIEKRVTAVEEFQQQMRGAGNLAQWTREFGPWLFSLGIVAWSVLGR